MFGFVILLEGVCFRAERRCLLLLCRASTFSFFSSLCGVGRPSALRRSLSSCFSPFVHCMVWFAAATSVVL